MQCDQLKSKRMFRYKIKQWRLQNRKLCKGSLEYENRNTLCYSVSCDRACVLICIETGLCPCMHILTTLMSLTANIFNP